MQEKRILRRAGNWFPLAARPVAALLAVAVLLVFAPLAMAAVLLETGGGAPAIPIIFPMEQRVNWTDTFGAARSGGRSHEGNDLMVPKMTPLVAVVDGTLDWMNFEGKTSSYNGLPYYNILLRGDDGNDYFYIHLNNDTPGTDDGRGGVANAYAAGLTNGTKVEAGQVIGYAGDSGNAEDSGSHLHFEIHRGGYKNPIDPYNSLKAAPTYAEWVAAGGSSTTAASTTTTAPSTTTTTAPPPSTTTTEPPGGQLDPELPRFTDVDPEDWFYADVADAYQAGVVNGGSDGAFRPYQDVTRAQFAAFLVRAFAPRALAEEEPAEQVFSDVSATFWGYDEISAAAAAGLVRGVGDGARFAPNAPITRAQMAAMVCRALVDPADLAAQSGGAVPVAAAGPDGSAPAGGDAGPGSDEEATEVESVRVFSDVPHGYWAAADIHMAFDLGVVSGGSDGRFRPEETTQRAHAVAVIARALRVLEEGAGP